MVNIITATKGKGIDELLRTLTPAIPEKMKKQTRLTKAVSGRDYLLSQLILLMEDDKMEEDWEAACQRYLAPIKAVLEPSAINEIFQMTLQYEQHEWYGDAIGAFVSTLIQNSYRKGRFTQFHLDTRSIADPKAFHSLGLKLRGKREQPIDMLIQGSGGAIVGHSSQRVRYYITDGVGMQCGANSSHCFYFIEGEAVADDFAREATHSTFIVNKFVYEPKDKIGFDARGCIFATYNLDTLAKMSADIPTGNKIYLLDKDGKQKLVKR